MNLIGTRFATFRDDDLLVKSEDLRAESRLPVRCYREALGLQFASRLGFAVPPTKLVQHPRYGRLVTRRWLANAFSPTTAGLLELCATTDGIRVLLLDLLVANRDRRPENLLVMNEHLIPIDFNVAFEFANDPPRTEAPSLTIMRWFGTQGVLSLPRHTLALINIEAARLCHLVSEPYIQWTVARLPSGFVDCEERSRLVVGLLSRRTSLASWLHNWWRRTVEPIHRITEVCDD